jgi:SWI/SNF-related matrix-associated actin-dependent regulator 1 of chromatin subfamily A
VSLKAKIKAAMRTPPLVFQVDGVRFLLNHEGRAVLGDDMGLGKTYQIATWLALNPDARPVIIACPATVKYVWQRQLWEHSRIKSVVINGRGRFRVNGNVWIINHDILSCADKPKRSKGKKSKKKGKTKKPNPGWWKTLIRRRPLVFVIDEAHRTQTRDSQRTMACKAIARRCRHVIAATGTPIRARPVQFFPMLNMVCPRAFPSFWQYAFRYCDPKRGFRGRGWNFNGASNLDELHQRVSAIMLRRTKEEVMKDLPRKTCTTIPVDIANRKEYESARDDFVSWWRKRRGAGVSQRALKAVAFVRMGALLRIAAEGKVPAISDWIENWLRETDQKLVVFTKHKIILALLRGTFLKAAVIEGRTPQRQREMEINRFQTDPKCRLFFGNLQAAGEGTTLHAASTVLFVELGWTPAELDQAEDRVLRIGQRAKHVDIYYMIAKDTQEEDVLELIGEKRKVVNQVVDGVSPSVQTIVLQRLVEESV